MKNRYWFITLLCASVALSSSAIAQEKTAKEAPATKDAKAKKADAKKDAKDDKKKDKKKDAKKTDEKKSDDEATKKVLKAEPNAENATAKAVEEKAKEVVEKPVVVEEPIVEKEEVSPIAELADKEFVPLEEIEEEELEQIIPAKVHPRVDWSGSFRIRTMMLSNFDLDTQGSSRILPPVESYAPIGNPADKERDTHWTNDMNLRIEPTLFITEDIKIHSEMNLLHNLILGSLPTRANGENPLQNTAGSADQFFKNAIEINELYGELNTIFGTLYAGRMDDEWGLGMYAQSGDCQDCNYGNHVDRFKLQTNLFGMYMTGTWDFPSEGLNTRAPSSYGGQSYDLAQVDEADQWTFSLEKKARTREELEKRSAILLEKNEWVTEGGVQYRYQSQEGTFVPNITDKKFDPAAPERLVYKGASAHIVDGWGSFVFQPEYDRFIKIRLEGLAAFGNVDNVSNSVVGAARTNNESALNCFDPKVRDANKTRCSTDDAGKSTQRDLLQFGLALESEFRINSPVIFGLNGGFASGGDTEAWGTAGENPDLKFFRFNPDYQIDLILFRQIIGTVTNAYYVNPHLELEFFETSGRHMEIGLDGIFSGVVNTKGGVSNGSLLGLELDTSLAYVMRDLFTAKVEAGILFPFSGLA